MHELMSSMRRRRLTGLNHDSAKAVGVPHPTLYERIVRGRTFQEAVDLGNEEAHRTWRFTRKDGSRVEHLPIVRQALCHKVSAFQIIDELELGYDENLTLEQAVERAKKDPWPLPGVATNARDAALVGLNESTLHYRLAKGMSYQDALETPARMVDSRASLDVRDLAVALGVSDLDAVNLVDALKRKRKKGHYDLGIMNTLLELPTVPSTPDELGRFVLDPGSPTCGEKINISALARHAGLEPNTLRTRLRNGWDLQEALMTPPGLQGSGAKRRLKGPEEQWPMYRKEAQRAQTDRAGLTARIVRDRIKDGWDEADAMAAPKGARRKHRCNISAAAREHGLKPETVRVRLKKGWTLHEALNTPLRHPRPSAVVASADAAQSEDSGT